MNVSFPESRLEAVVRKAYELSRPQGLGMLHWSAGPLSDEDLKLIVDQPGKTVHMDYVNGRAVKLYIRYNAEAGEFYWVDSGEWFDHLPAERESLLKVMKGEL